ncbi:hypothetical protein FA13DRAFT_1784174 [Coprinellus micaceus]|uniref:Uncharacterized protein n=1 Tax=Coprinellus micaceus TaxID=71717 RepID=A0A4Y7TZ12_COPMI|nr:hypothetical protein FA13DRAFT_1784174 [Coprinellus micaceus]
MSAEPTEADDPKPNLGLPGPSHLQRKSMTKSTNWRRAARQHHEPLLNGCLSPEQLFEVYQCIHEFRQPHAPGCSRLASCQRHQHFLREFLRSRLAGRGIDLSRSQIISLRTHIMKCHLCPEDARAYASDGSGGSSPPEVPPHLHELITAAIKAWDGKRFFDKVRGRTRFIHAYIRERDVVLEQWQIQSALVSIDKARQLQETRKYRKIRRAPPASDSPEPLDRRAVVSSEVPAELGQSCEGISSGDQLALADETRGLTEAINAAIEGRELSFLSLVPPGSDAPTAMNGINLPLVAAQFNTEPQYHSETDHLAGVPILSTHPVDEIPTESVDMSALDRSLAVSWDGYHNTLDFGSTPYHDATVHQPALPGQVLSPYQWSEQGGTFILTLMSHYNFETENREWAHTHQNMLPS